MVISALPCHGRRLAPFAGGQLLSPLAFLKGGLPMVTYSDLFQFGLLIVGVIGVCIAAMKR